MANKTFDQSESASSPAWLKVVQHQVEAIRYGFVQLTIHDGRVVQVERTERVRLDPASGTDLPRI